MRLPPRVPELIGLDLLVAIAEEGVSARRPDCWASANQQPVNGSENPNGVSVWRSFTEVPQAQC